MRVKNNRKSLGRNVSVLTRKNSVKSVNRKQVCGTNKKTHRKKSCGCSGRKNSLVSTLNQMGGFVRDGSVQFFHKMIGA